ncbi:MAG: OsmC family protein [Anaerolineae bacterium]|nr:OsmC family protein [Anaerolineae bacterium]
MPVRSAEATWQGTFKEGAGNIKLESGAYDGPFNFTSRFEDGNATNPEELLAGAHAGCYTMALNLHLIKDGFTPTRVHTVAEVTLEKGESGFSISHIHLITEAEVPNISAEAFAAHAEDTKNSCIVSRALSAVPMSLEAKLV